jgi:hypothetical protein
VEVGLPLILKTNTNIKKTNKHLNMKYLLMNFFFKSSPPPRGNCRVMLTDLCILRRNSIFWKKLKKIFWRFRFWRRLGFEVLEGVKWGIKIQ